MKIQFKVKYLLVLSFAVVTLLMQGGPLFAEDVPKATSTEVAVSSSDSSTPKDAANKSPDLKTALMTDQTAVKAIEKKQAETTSQIKEAVKDVEQVKVEAQQLTEEKQVVEKVAEAKAQEAIAVKEEAKVALTEALKTGDVVAKKKAQELSQVAEKLEGEAHAGEEKAKALGLKAGASEQKVAANVAAIEAMKKQMEALQKEKQSKRGLIDKSIYGGIVILVGLFFLWLLGFAIKRFEAIVSEKDAIRESEKVLRMKTLSELFKWAGSLLIFGVVFYMVMENFGINMAPFLAGAGILGLAFGFGGQYLIRDIINGIFILVEGQYRINDVVKIGETGGLVESINLRITKLRDLEGRVIYIPNGKVETVINFTQEYAQAVLDIGIAYKENVDHVMNVIKDIAEEMRKDSYFGKLILADLEMLGVDAFADSQVTIKCRFKTLPIKQWEVAREFRRRIKNKFDELGIEIPFPHRTLYWGTGEENKWLQDALNQKGTDKSAAPTTV